MVLIWLWDSKLVSLPGKRLTRTEFTSIKREVYEHVNKNDICRSLIGPKYLKNTILKSKFLLVSRTENSVNGFASFDFIGKSLFIELICSGEKGLGSDMLNKILDYANSDNNIEYITLESISNAYDFYKKKGFELYCPDGGLCPMYRKK